MVYEHNRFLGGHKVRKKQIADWFKELIVSSGNSHRSVKIINLWNSKKYNEAFKEWQTLVEIIGTDINSPFSYVYQFNVSINRSQFYAELFMFVYNRNIVVQPKRTKELDKKIIQQELEETKPLEKKERIFFGINKKGEKEKAVRIINFDKGKPFYQYRSVETGKFLKGTKALDKATDNLRRDV